MSPARRELHGAVRKARESLSQERERSRSRSRGRSVERAARVAAEATAAFRSESDASTEPGDPNDGAEYQPAVPIAWSEDSDQEGGPARGRSRDRRRERRGRTARSSGGEEGSRLASVRDRYRSASRERAPTPSLQNDAHVVESGALIRAAESFGTSVQVSERPARACISYGVSCRAPAKPIMLRSLQASISGLATSAMNENDAHIVVNPGVAAKHFEKFEDGDVGAQRGDVITPALSENDAHEVVKSGLAARHYEKFEEAALRSEETNVRSTFTLVGGGMYSEPAEQRKPFKVRRIFVTEVNVVACRLSSSSFSALHFYLENLIQLLTLHSFDNAYK